MKIKSIKMEPPVEYPKVYYINFLLPGTNPEKLDLYRESLRDRYYHFTYHLEIWGTPTRSLSEYLGMVSIGYKTFLDSLTITIEGFGETEDPRDDFTPWEQFLDIKEDIETTSREGDILVIEGYSFYISGFGNDREVVKIYMYDLGDNEYILPKQALAVVRDYKIHELKDMNKIYPNLNFVYIEVPARYLPKSSTFDRPALLFPLTDRNTYHELGTYKLDLGEYGYIYTFPSDVDFKEMVWGE